MLALLLERAGDVVTRDDDGHASHDNWRLYATRQARQLTCQISISNRALDVVEP